MAYDNNYPKGSYAWALGDEAAPLDGTTPSNTVANNTSPASSYTGPTVWRGGSTFTGPYVYNPNANTTTLDAEVKGKTKEEGAKEEPTNATRSRILNNKSNKTSFSDFDNALNSYDDVATWGSHMSNKEIREFAKQNNLHLTNLQLRTLKRGYNETNGGALSRLFNKGNQLFADNVMSNYLNKKVDRLQYFDLNGNRHLEGEDGYTAGSGFATLLDRNKAISDWYANANNWSYDTATGKSRVKAFTLSNNGLLAADGNSYWDMDEDTYKNLGLTGDYLRLVKTAAGRQLGLDAMAAKEAGYTGSEFSRWKNMDAVAKELLTADDLKLKKSDPTTYRDNLVAKIREYMKLDPTLSSNPHQAYLFMNKIDDLGKNEGINLKLQPSHPYNQYSLYMTPEQRQALNIGNGYYMPTFNRNGGNIQYFVGGGELMNQLTTEGSTLRSFIPGVASYDAIQQYRKGEAGLDNLALTIAGDALTFIPGVGLLAQANRARKAAKALNAVNKSRKKLKAVNNAGNIAKQKALAKYNKAQEALKEANAARKAPVKVLGQEVKTYNPTIMGKTFEFTPKRQLLTGLAIKGAKDMYETRLENLQKDYEDENPQMALPQSYTQYQQPEILGSSANIYSSDYNWVAKLGGKMPNINYFQAGGAVNAQPQQGNNIEQQVVQLVQAAMQGDQQATLTIEKIMQAALSGDQQATQIAQLIQEVAKQMQSQSQMAKYGAKVAYLRKLKTGVNADEEVIYQKCGGKTVKRVVKKACGGVTKDACGGKAVKEACGGKTMKKAACGSKMKKKGC